MTRKTTSAPGPGSENRATRPPSRTVLSLSALALLITGGLLYAGPLDPPAGPVAPTYKTLAEVEPRTAINAANTPGDADSLFKITRPGSYYLTGNITGVANKHGIEIAASGVTLDLNGFDLSGISAMGLFDGVSVTVAGLTNIAVVNGSVRNWGDAGVNLGTFGIITANNCRVAGLLASDNAGNGINAGLGSTVTNCSAFSNTGSGISINTGSTVADCTARSNTLDGIVCFSDCMIRGNRCSNNGSGGDGAGIHAISGDNRIEGNNCTFADRGIDVDFAGNIIIRNTCSGNTINWVIVASNYYGPIIDRTGVATPPVNGSAGTFDALASTHPNANFSY